MNLTTETYKVKEGDWLGDFINMITDAAQELSIQVRNAIDLLYVL